jgi:hypothetical protein
METHQFTHLKYETLVARLLKDEQSFTSLEEIRPFNESLEIDEAHRTDRNQLRRSAALPNHRKAASMPTARSSSDSPEAVTGKCGKKYVILLMDNEKKKNKQTGGDAGGDKERGEGKTGKLRLVVNEANLRRCWEADSEFFERSTRRLG